VDSVLDQPLMPVQKAYGVGEHLLKVQLLRAIK